MESELYKTQEDISDIFKLRDSKSIVKQEIDDVKFWIKSRERIRNYVYKYTFKQTLTQNEKNSVALGIAKLSNKNICIYAWWNIENNDLFITSCQNKASFLLHHKTNVWEAKELDYNINRNDFIWSEV